MRTELYQQYSRTKVRSCVSTSWVHCPSRNWQSSEKRDRKSTGTTPEEYRYDYRDSTPTTEYRSVSLQPFPSNFQQQLVHTRAHRITYRLLFANYKHAILYTIRTKCSKQYILFLITTETSKRYNVPYAIAIGYYYFCEVHQQQQH